MDSLDTKMVWTNLSTEKKARCSLRESHYRTYRTYSLLVMGYYSMNIFGSIVLPQFTDTILPMASWKSMGRPKVDGTHT